MTEIICYDTDVVEEEKKAVTLAVSPITKHSWQRRVGLFKIIRTNGKETETIITAPCFKGKRFRKVSQANPEDIFDYEQDVKHDVRRNDKLMKDVNEAYNLLYRKGYLCKVMGFRGRVKAIDYRSAKLIINTTYDSKVIRALLELYFPNRDWRIE